MRANRIAAAWLLLALTLFAQVCQAQEQRFSFGLAVGAFDVDTDDSDGPHLNDLSYSALLGFDWSKYLALEAEFMHVEDDSTIDVFGERSAFSGDAVALSIRLQWPLADDFKAYVRLGGAAFQLTDAEIQDVSLDDQQIQKMLMMLLQCLTVLWGG